MRDEWTLRNVGKAEVKVPWREISMRGWVTKILLFKHMIEKPGDNVFHIEHVSCLTNTNLFVLVVVRVHVSSHDSGHHIFHIPYSPQVFVGIWHVKCRSAQSIAVSMMRKTLRGGQNRSPGIFFFVVVTCAVFHLTIATKTLAKAESSFAPDTVVAFDSIGQLPIKIDDTLGGTKNQSFITGRDVSSPVPAPPVYTASDDASWAITSQNLSNDILNSDKQAVYDTFITECVSRDKNCEAENKIRIKMNVEQPKSVVNYTKTGFKKIRAPESLYRLIKEFWDNNRDETSVELNGASPYHNSWSVPTNILPTEDSNLIGGGYNLSAAIWNQARTLLENWTGQKLSGSSVYGVRVYHNQSILLPHVDRLPLGTTIFRFTVWFVEHSNTCVSCLQCRLLS